MTHDAKQSLTQNFSELTNSVNKAETTYSFKTQRLKKIYLSGETQVQALRGVDIEIPSGELVVMLGPSGSGKSTFLNIIGGLDQASSGHVYFKGKDLATLTSRELTYYRRENIGFVFQAYNLVPSLTALENVALVTEISPNPMDPLEALSIVGLKERACHFPSQMSGGEQQRVAIARALAKQPEVMLCDEPTGALDSETGIVVLKALMAVNEKYATTCIIITHNASIAQLAHRVIHFADGEVSKVVVNQQRKQPDDIDW
ncbi:ABC transporter ATP-binding protein [Aliikangiella maris]|uniref:ABC transporter ATP-binding protein n=2 Tax=Aliikangiella maris TaxID=3162458 RepID=A0ABV2BPV1_9GAMM